jgi:glucose/arabinose dehydrogenase
VAEESAIAQPTNTGRRKTNETVTDRWATSGTGGDPGRCADERRRAKAERSLPFDIVQVATLKLPWRIAFLPDGRMLINEKVSGMELVTQQGAKKPVASVRLFFTGDKAGCSAFFSRRTRNL